MTIPEGIYCGDIFNVDYCGGTYDITCPDGCGPGMAIVVDLPAGTPPEQPAETTTTPVEVVVPDGVFSGDYFSVDFAGMTYDITCPEGCGPGAAIIVDLPVGPPEQQPPTEPPPSSFKEKENDLPPGYEKIGKKGKGLALSLNIGGGLKLSLALATVRTFKRSRYEKHMFRPLPPPSDVCCCARAHHSLVRMCAAFILLVLTARQVQGRPAGRGIAIRRYVEPGQRKRVRLAGVQLHCHAAGHQVEIHGRRGGFEVPRSRLLGTERVSNERPFVCLPTCSDYPAPFAARVVLCGTLWLMHENKRRRPSARATFMRIRT